MNDRLIWRFPAKSCGFATRTCGFSAKTYGLAYALAFAATFALTAALGLASALGPTAALGFGLLASNQARAATEELPLAMAVKLSACTGVGTDHTECHDTFSETKTANINLLPDTQTGGLSGSAEVSVQAEGFNAAGTVIVRRKLNSQGEPTGPYLFETHVAGWPDSGKDAGSDSVSKFDVSSPQDLGQFEIYGDVYVDKSFAAMPSLLINP